jgi:hypothetical protein
MIFGNAIKIVKLINICNLLCIEQRNARDECPIEFVINDGIQQSIGRILVITNETMT